MNEQVPERRTGIARVIKACSYTWDGLAATFRSEAAFRQELGLAVVMIPLALWLGKTATDKALMIACVFAVLVVELLNSAIEAAINRFGPEWNAYSKHAKDAGSAAVFVSLCMTGAVWALCLFG